MRRYRFNAKVEAGDGGGAYVLFPFDVEKEFGTKGKVPVQAKFNGVPYAGTLIKYGNPLHMLPMLKAIREQTGTSPGDTVDVELWKDEEPRVLEVPADFREAMKNQGVMPLFDRLSFTHRREYCRWITEAKKDETRMRRVGKAVELLAKGVKTPDDSRTIRK
jgi:Domain of unknown function (DUF1905)/Bacteriocin-protection, YdeI or OmpD-Associated